MTWISIRHQWPTDSKRYKVKNCLRGCEGTAFYNGYSWEQIEMSTNGALILYVDKDFVTHWQE